MATKDVKRYGYNIKRRNLSWQGEIEGTEEQHLSAATKTRNYLYKLLDYSEKEEIPSPEEIEEMRRIYSYARQGPRAWYQRFNKKNKLTSADVLHILSSKVPSRLMAKYIGISDTKVRKIRRGEMPCWEWEFDLIRRLKGIITADLKYKVGVRQSLYVVSKLVKPGVYEDLYYTTSQRRGNALIKDMLTKKEYDKLTKEGTLSLHYKVRKEDII